MLLSEIVARLGGELVGDDLDATGLAPLGDAKAGEMSFLANMKYVGELESTGASCVIVPKGDFKARNGMSLIVSDNPYLYFARAAWLFHPKKSHDAGIHPSSHVDAEATVEEGAYVGPCCVVGKGSRIGKGALLMANVVVGENSIVGDGSVIHPSAVIYDDVKIGADCIVHAGAVLGADGFGNVKDEADRWLKIPQTGGVSIGDRVEIGANTTIDRGAMKDTVVGDDCKIDNLVQIGHNCKIGRNTAIAACAGISGSTEIGENCVIGGASMFVGHIKIAAGTVIGGGTGVTKSITEPDYYASHYPMSTFKEWRRNAAQLRHLDEIGRRLAKIERELAAKAEGKDGDRN